MPFATDEDIVKLVRGYDSHAYVYVGGEGGPSNVAVREGGEVVGGNGGASLPIVGGVEGCVNVVLNLVQCGRGSSIKNHTR